MSVLMWLIALGLGMGLGFLMGRDYGYRAGNRRGYTHALQQAMEIDRPMYQLCRVLVPAQAPIPVRDRYEAQRRAMWD